MTVQELQTRLFELDIPHYYYNICGSGDEEDQRICVVNEGGKWLVYYSEDGDRMELSIPTQDYGYLVEGDHGKLTFQGTRYLSFERA